MSSRMFVVARSLNRAFVARNVIPAFVGHNFSCALAAMFFVAAMFFCASLAAAGQQVVASDDAAQRQRGSEGPLVLKPIKAAGLIAIDAKVTQVNRGTGTLVGAYGGRLFDETLLIGAGGYALTQRVGGVTMGYGGLVLGWQTNAKQTVSFMARGLIGGGQATVMMSGVTFLRALDVDPQHLPGMIATPISNSFSFRYRTSFFVAEPQIDVVLRASDRVRVDLGAGYRAVGQSGGVDRQLRGATGSVSIQFKIGG